MGGQIGWGLMLVLLGGALNGSFVAPMKRLANWRWENTWLIYATTGLVIVPWLVAMGTVPHLASIYHQASWPVLVRVILYGFAFGIGVTLFGFGVFRIGLALGFPVTQAVATGFGCLLPLAMLHPDQFHTHRGLALIMGTLVVIVALVFLSIAGWRREREQNPGAVGPARSGFGVGLVMCILSGIFSSMFNFAFVFGDELKQRALAAGSSPAMASNAIWALALSSSLIANAAYCIYLLNKNHTWGVFISKGTGTAYWLGGALMGVVWFGGVILYGMGAVALGPLGGIIGWPVFLSTVIIAGVTWGIASGEWKGSSRTSLGYCLVGLGILFLAVAVIARGNAA
ncbi:MAG: L-rhamnose/proton symporter RhaT [Terriglobia bacterium]